MAYSVSFVLWILRQADKNIWVLHVGEGIIDITLSFARNIFISPDYLFFQTNIHLEHNKHTS